VNNGCIYNSLEEITMLKSNVKFAANFAE